VVVADVDHEIRIRDLALPPTPRPRRTAHCAGSLQRW
jgi:hypothetical protein